MSIYGKKSIIYQYAVLPPEKEDSLHLDSQPEESIFPPAFCSNVEDIPSRPMEIGGQLLKLRSNHAYHLKEFEGKFQNDGIENWKVLLKSIENEDLYSENDVINSELKRRCVKFLTPLKEPPSQKSLLKWLREKQNEFKQNKEQKEPEIKHLGSDVNKCGESNKTAKRLFSNIEAETDITNNSEPQRLPDKDTSNLKREVSFKSITSTPKVTKAVGSNRKSENSGVNCVSLFSVNSPTDSSQKGSFPSSIQNNSFQLECEIKTADKNKSQQSEGRLFLNKRRKMSGSEYSKRLKGLSARRNRKSASSQRKYSQSQEPLSTTLLDSEDIFADSNSLSPIAGLLKKEQSRSSSPLSCNTPCDANEERKLFHNSQFRRQFYSPSPHSLSYSQVIGGPSPNSTYGFKFQNHNLKEAKALHKNEFLTIMCIECHVTTRSNYLPDPELDSISALVFSITQDVPDDHPTPKQLKGAIIVSSKSCDLLLGCGVNSSATLFVASEKELYTELIRLLHHWDPDILVGYEVQMSSWGYVLERGAVFIPDVVSLLSRIPEGSDSHFEDEKDEYGADHTHQIHIAGRVVLNVWRLMRAEVALTSYTLENVAYNVLHVRIPTYTHDTLTKWWTSTKNRHRTLEHYSRRCDLTVELLHRLDLLTRTAELARLFGIQFYEVLARGSQFRVESMMLRLSRGQNMIAVSPDVRHRAQMKAPEWLALTMEPESKYYTDPVVVLDFQSLYPSMMIAYNYCYSTCLGRVSSLGHTDEPFILGASNLRVPPRRLASLIDQINVSPCGVAFVQPSVRRGILPTMLHEILNTRIMVKSAMKAHPDDPSLTRLLHSRQLGLKLIANVTYGYTSANFSGRMPCVELGDSVVSKGRETLERAIALVNADESWGARVVYGDTDSLFVLLPNRSKEEAFRIGKEMAERVTQCNPKPVKLKFEKVYLPCILQTKKRYVGYMYESPGQKEPVFDAKGIETVRRDGCPATAKVLEKGLRILFKTSDVSQVKAFVQRQFKKLLQGNVNLQDLIIAKEFRGRNGYKPGACVPALELAKQWTRVDRRKEPRVGERVPYVIVYGAPGLPLIRLIRSPDQLVKNPTVRINAIYYATKAILPPLQRCLSLLGVDVNKWFYDLPRPSHLGMEGALCLSSSRQIASSSSIARFMSMNVCMACGGNLYGNFNEASKTCHSSTKLCADCHSNSQKAVLTLTTKIRDYQRAVDQVSKICRSCIGYPLGEVDCISIDCPVFFKRSNAVAFNRVVVELDKAVNEF